jgi:hypothetical protein
MFASQKNARPLNHGNTTLVPGLPRVHDESFHPDHILRVSRKRYCVGGIIRYTTLVNNSLPGPELHIPEGKVVWIRVYNDMPDANLTIVSELTNHLHYLGSQLTNEQ